ncbi:MAG: GTP-binding protein [Candidatus Asgardarchaeia archaeon]
MVRKNLRGDIYFKLTFWGPSGGGKTTSVDALYKICNSDKKDIFPTTKFTKISMGSGSTLFFDRGVFKIGDRTGVFFQVYTVAGQQRFRDLRKVIWRGTDGVVFVADSRREVWNENVDSLKELKRVVENDGKRLIRDIPLVVQLNKRDLEDIISVEEMIELLKAEDLYYPIGHKYYMWNPRIYETIAIKGINVYEAFAECSRRILIYFLHGNGSAPLYGEMKTR